ncbi:hypothetical protein BDR26DRAFT_852196 [Obelidium mucronatum]|nr:hypothetical protein BDR26DRAFT_852196 [Obelidium mucronatum]
MICSADTRCDNTLDAAPTHAADDDGGRGLRQSVQIAAPAEHTVRFGVATTQLQTSVHVAGRPLFRELRLVFSHYGAHCADRRLDAAADAAAQAAAPSSTQANKPNVAALLLRTKPAVPVLAQDKLLIVQTFQRSTSDLMVVNDASNQERNFLLECFSTWGRFVITRIRDKGYWADMTDPCSGYPVYTPRGTSLYPDVDGASLLLKYSTHLVGCCRIISHPVW